MGLFSNRGKNKQEADGQDSGYYSRDDQAANERARSKRASSADGGNTRGRASREDNDPVLPEKKRARRRLVGAIMLALLVAIGLPMLLDSEPKPLSNDIDIRIPSKDKAPEPAPAAAAPLASSAPVAASATLDSGEEVVAEPSKLSKPTPKPAPLAIAPPPVAKVELPSEQVKVKETVKADAKADTKIADTKIAKAEHKPDVKPEPKAEAKPDSKAEPKADAKVADAKPAKSAPKDDGAQSSDDAARAMAILEGKPVKPADAAQKIVYQVAALKTQDKADELLAKLRGAGIKSFTHKSASDDLIRVRIGPFTSKEEADAAHAKLAKLGLSVNPV